MTTIESKLLLKNLIEDLEKANYQLEHSLSVCQDVKNKKNYTQDELDKIEALSARFARLTDILFKRAYRTLDAYLLEEGGTFIDVLNRADKRGLINSIDEMRIIKDVRNLIAHEYALSHFDKITADIFLFSPILVLLVKKFNTYCEKL